MAPTLDIFDYCTGCGISPTVGSTRLCYDCLDPKHPDQPSVAPPPNNDERNWEVLDEYLQIVPLENP